MNESEYDEIRLVRLSGGAVFLLAAVMAVVMPKTPVISGVEGLAGAVVAFELASTPEHVLAVLGPADHPSRPGVVQAMDRTNRIDFLFMLAYPALCAAIAALLVARGLAPEVLTKGVGLLAIAMMVGDFFENRQLLVLSHLTDPAAMLEPLSRLRVATAIKWAALFVAALVEAPFVWRDASAWRWSAPLFALGGILGLAGVAWRPGIEHGANVVALAWLWTWVHALRRRA